MSSPRSGYAYAKEFVGNMRAESEPVPVRVNTRLRVMTPETAREVQKYGHMNEVPQYEIGSGGELPLHPSLQAMGRHYFEW